MAAKRRVDYDRIEPDWRAGIKSPEQLAAEYTAATGDTVSRVAIIKHFEKRGIARDLGAKIKAKAEAMVAASMVTGKVSAEREATDTAIIEAGALAAANVLVAHRADIHRVRMLGLSLLGELEGQGASRDDLTSLGELLRAEDEKGQDKLNDLYRKVISTPSRIDSAKKVAETLRYAISMGREAYGLDAKKPGEAPGEITITF